MGLEMTTASGVEPVCVDSAVSAAAPAPPVTAYTISEPASMAGIPRAAKPSELAQTAHTHNHIMHIFTTIEKI